MCWQLPSARPCSEGFTFINLFNLPNKHQNIDTVIITSSQVRKMGSQRDEPPSQSPGNTAAMAVLLNGLLCCFTK